MGGEESKVNVRVRGMTCPACELRIESALLKKPGVQAVNADYRRGVVQVVGNFAANGAKMLEEELERLGYAVFDGNERNGSRAKLWLKGMLAAAAVAAGYLLLEQAGVFYLFPVPEAGMNLTLLFLVGLMTSTHCVAMCGGINISQCAGKMNGLGGYRSKTFPSLLYNGGRVFSYTVIGGIAGGIGSVVTPGGGVKAGVVIVAGIFMVLMGLNLLGFFSGLRGILPRVPKFAARKINSGKKGKGPFLVGMLNGLMPCGPLQAMQLYALSTGSFAQGALSMLVFSLGTVPLMFGLGALSSFLSARFTGVMLKASGAMVIFLGIVMLNNGLSLYGLDSLF